MYICQLVALPLHPTFHFSVIHYPLPPFPLLSPSATHPRLSSHSSSPTAATITYADTHTHAHYPFLVVSISYNSLFYPILIALFCSCAVQSSRHATLSSLVLPVRNAPTPLTSTWSWYRTRTALFRTTPASNLVSLPFKYPYIG